MTARILDGAAIAGAIIVELKQRVTALKSLGIQPGLAALQVGDNPASRIYLRNKAKSCADAGVRSETHQLDANCNEADVLQMIDRFNRTPGVHGIIVQLPLPKHFDAGRILQSIAVEKDVDGFNWRNLGALVDKQPELVPCTPLGVMALLDYIHAPVEGRDAVIVGRSGIVGMPAALLLIARGATVTVCNSKTVNLSRFTTQADILVSAVGRPGIIRASMVKPGAIVIDVGITRLPDGKITGDVDFEGVKEVASWLTPVPGGVGPMTVAMLIANTIKAAERSAPKAGGG
jgi:methylenetetrahydrofolate dehydrogenase (NADP+)/methenyltetrahydrofolate cyclohydrolase